jgi:hypothetical protein
MSIFKFCLMCQIPWQLDSSWAEGKSVANCQWLLLAAAGVALLLEANCEIEVVR